MARYGLLGDIHGNLEALEAALSCLDAHGVDEIACVGDLVGYNADPDACVDLLRKRGVAAIAGNHDLIGTGRLGFDRCSNKAMHALKRTRRYIGGETASYLRSLPSHLEVEDHVVLTHGGVRDVQQYMTHPKHIVENVGYLRHDFPGRKICFFGHTHEQKVFEVDGDAVNVTSVEGPAVVRLVEGREYFVNPGSVDASRKRAHKLAEYAVFDSDSLTVEFGRTPYDDTRTEERAAASGFRIDPWRDRLYDLRRRLAAPARWTIQKLRVGDS
jgi:predicted phosphodiesterase